MSSDRRSLPGAGGEAGAGHALTEAAFSEEVLFEAAELLVEEVVGLVNDADDDIGHHFGRAGFQIGPIGRIGRITVIRLATEGAIGRYWFRAICTEIPV